MIRVNNVKLKPGYKNGDVVEAISSLIGAKSSDVESFTEVKLSIDARDKKDVFYVGVFDVSIKDEKKYYGRRNVLKCEHYEYEYPTPWREKHRPIVVGSGPSGLFCALILAYRGANPIVIERGECVENRVNTVNNFWKTGRLNTESNVQFGEGGAGTFSDGKLNTGTKDKRQRKVLEEMVEAGAPREILYKAKPHVGTDELRTMVSNIRKKIISMGGEFIFNCRMDDILINNNAVAGIKTTKGDFETKTLILAIGHSARDTFEMLKKLNIPMERKPFSVGARIEHLREDIDYAQYGDFAPLMGAADYKCNIKASNGRGVYTFCMCPGGFVVPSASEEEGVVTNGMSNFARDGVNSNSAILVSLYPEDFQSSDVLSGMYFQRKVEKSAFYQAGGDYKAPCQMVGDFLNNRKSTSFKKVLPTYEIGVTYSDLNRLFPEFVSTGLKEAILGFGRKIKGFDNPHAILTGAETRSSCPVRILRNELFSSCVSGLYPIGEGAGYAGGIMSAAVDGIKVGEVAK
ncbi:MAG: NAD(P)/FAD-dependent oxidoreductase [Clostridia bacterium]